MTTHAPSPLKPEAANARGTLLRQVCIHVERLLILAHKQAPHGSEADLVRIFLEAHGCGHFDERLPQQSSADTVVKEFALRHGRADLVFFHMDGTATVIEAKDGTKGYNHVVGGIGQCSLYAAQLLAKKGALKSVQRALLWSSAGLSADHDIERACNLAGVTPLPYQSIRDLMATEAATRKVLGSGLKSFEEVAHGRPYPAFKPVFESAQQFIDDVSSVANQAAQVAPRLIPRVETLGDMLGKTACVT